MQNISRVINQILEKKNVKISLDELMTEAIQDKDVQEFIAKNKAKLDEGAVEKSSANIYEYVTQKQATENDSNNPLSGYAPHLIVNDGLIEVSYEPTQAAIEKSKQKKLAKQLNYISLPDSLKTASLNDYNDGSEGRFEALAGCASFIRDYLNGEVNKGFFLCGDFGVGKTYLLAATANKLAEKGTPVSVVHFPTFASTIRSQVQNNTAIIEIERLQKTPILMLDDIGAETLTTWIRDDVLGVILQYRMERRLPTFFSSNFSMAELENHLTYVKGDVEPVKAKRIMERVKSLSHEVTISGSNRRNPE
ncbi:primosomal protein DnaI [Holzapfeliella sp. He02]|uniref:Primosomal protein DnaI n=1 Tax=Holzapfeliella saturejae TaxID=3082953 RepID=A0ABU8SGX6_9LACO